MKRPAEIDDNSEPCRDFVEAWLRTYDAGPNNEDSEPPVPANPEWYLDIPSQLEESWMEEGKEFAIQENNAAPTDSTHWRQRMLADLAIELLRLCHQAGIGTNSELDARAATAAELLYRRFRSRLDVRTQGTLLQCLTWNRRSESLKRYCLLVTQQPPAHWMATATSLSPLLRSKDWSVGAVFPSLLDGLMYPTTIAPILDVCNWVRRNELMPQHPAWDLRGDLIGLLGQVVGRLGRLEEHPEEFGENVEQVQRVLGDSVALCISLCDTVGWLQDESAVGKLNQALELSHRRIQAEAAAALVRLKQSHGRERLLALAADPSTRLRVLTYAEELGFADAIDEKYSVPAARAESELAIWLAQPENFGIPPTQMELVDDRLLYWPGYEAPQQAYLYRYTYSFRDQSLSNIGIAGPLVHAFHADLGNLPTDDIYAIFAGWHVEHDELFEIDMNQLNARQREVADRLVKYLEESEYEDIRPLFLGFMFGDIALVARVSNQNTEGISVADGQEIEFQPTVGRLRPFGPAETYFLYRGRKLIRAFNP